MDRVLYIIAAGERDERLSPLTEYRPKAMLRFGSGGTLMDFSLYNALTSDTGDAVVLTDYLSDMVDGYLRRLWKPAFDAHSKKLLPLHCKRLKKERFEGDGDAVYHALKMLSSFNGGVPETVAVLPPDHIYKMDFRHLIKFHHSHGAAITLAATIKGHFEEHGADILSVRNDCRITEFHHSPQNLDTTVPSVRNPLAAMGVYVFQRDTLLKYLERNQAENSHDLSRDILPMMIASEEARAFIFAKKDGKNEYWRDIRDIHSYWRTHMDILNGQFKELLLSPIPGLYQTPFSANNLVRRAEIGRRRIFNCIVSETARIGNADIEEAIIGPDVLIEDGASIRRSVILDGAVIRKWSTLDGAVVEPLAEVHYGCVPIKKVEAPETQPVPVMEGSIEQYLAKPVLQVAGHVCG